MRAEEGDANVPANWKDDGTTLTAPNGVTVVRGFRAKVLEGWDANNLPLEKERAVNPVEHANPMVGAGQFKLSRIVDWRGLQPGESTLYQSVLNYCLWRGNGYQQGRRCRVNQTLCDTH